MNQDELYNLAAKLANHVDAEFRKAREGGVAFTLVVHTTPVPMQLGNLSPDVVKKQFAALVEDMSTEVEAPPEPEKASKKKSRRKKDSGQE